MSATVTMLDMKGLACPMPVVWTAKAMKEARPGELFEVLATDVGAAPDFRAWCRATGNELVESSREHGVTRLLIRKR